MPKIDKLSLTGIIFLIKPSNLAVNKFLLLLLSSNGGLAQLARAFAWHARGHRFDSDILHLIIRLLE